VNTLDDITDTQRAQLRGDLEALVEELERLLALSKQGTRPVELDQAATGRISRVDAIQQQQMASAARGRAGARLHLVLAALANDEYGLCRRCEEPVGFGRLSARPETAYCVVCAEALERSY
jgi:DnaK suppressor protein